MSKTKTVNLTDRALSAVRAGESLSGRMNRIVDRYLSIISDGSHGMREPYSDQQWSMLLAAAAPLSLTPAADLRTAFIEIVERRDKAMGERIRFLPTVSVIVLIEMLEAELLAENAGNHKR